MPIIPYPKGIDLNVQSVEVPGTRVEGRSAAYKNAYWPHSRLSIDEKGVLEPRTLFELFEQSVARHPHQALFLRRPVIPAAPPALDTNPTYGTTLVPTSYVTVQRRRTALGSALLSLERLGRLRDPKIDPKAQSPPEITHEGLPEFGSENRKKAGARRGWAVGVWSKNREEWQVVDLACQAYGLVGVSLYETLGPNVAQYITNHCPLSIIFASSNHLADLLRMAPHCPALRAIVTMDTLSRAERDVLTQWAGTLGLLLLDMDELERWGKEDGIYCEPGPVKGDENEFDMDRNRIVTISYTSGTTGDPKGVVLTNWNLTSAVISNSLGGSDDLPTKDWRFLSYLPLSHIYERFLQILVIYGDGTIAMTTGDTTKLLEDAQLIKPDFMAGVPRVYNRINAAVKTQMDTPGLKGALLRQAINTKLANWRQHGQIRHRVYDALVFRKIRNLLGGKLAYISSGAAPLSAEVHEMLKICFSCDVVQGFGMTETIGTCTKGIPFDVGATGTCGQIQPCNEVQLADVAEMGYTSKDLPNPRGEVLLRGSNISHGYLHDKENTAKAIGKDGWMRTGDIGEIDSVGRLKIIDRVKNVVKLSQGEYVALEKLEGMYALDPLFATLLVHGDSLRSSLVAIAVLDPALAAKLVTEVLGKNVSADDVAGLEGAVKDKRVRKKVVESLAKVAKGHKLNGFEMIKGVHLTLRPFDEDLLTPTFKVKRNIAAKRFKEEIDGVYEEIEKGGDAAAKL